jgi:transcriptional regulator with XRE-family HTH domain
MPQTTVDVQALYAALDAKRKNADKSWRELAGDLKLSPSTFTRMAQGHNPDVDSFATLLRWLGMSADPFMRPSASPAQQQPDPVAMLSSYLRADRTIKPADADALTDILQAAYKNMKRRR